MVKSREDVLKAARQHIAEWTVQEVNDQIKSGRHLALLDVRGLDEWERGHLKEAIHIPRGEMEAQVESALRDKSGEIVIYCAGGVRSLLAGETLKALGYENVISMAGGYGDWADAGLPVETPPPPEEIATPDDPEMLAGQIQHLEKVLAEKKKRLAGLG